jgi:hypothetical protein
MTSSQGAIAWHLARSLWSASARVDGLADGRQNDSPDDESKAAPRSSDLETVEWTHIGTSYLTDHGWLHLRH